MAPAAPSVWPTMLLLLADRQPVGVVAEGAADRLRLGRVVERRRGPVRHDDLAPAPARGARRARRALHRQRRAVARRVRRRDVERVAGQRAAGDLGDGRRRRGASACSADSTTRMPGRLAEDEAVAIGIERARGRRRVVVALRERAHVAERGEGDRHDGALGAAGDDDVHVAVLDEPLRLDECLHAGRAGRHRGDDRAADPVLDADLGRRPSTATSSAP